MERSTPPRWLRQRAGCQTSRFRETPTTTASSVRPAQSRRCCGMTIRPCPSGSASCALATRKRWKRTRAGSVRGRLAMAAFNDSHSGAGKSARHSGSQRVTTAPSLKRGRNFAGIASRPFSSSWCANSPAKMLSTDPFDWRRRFPTVPHYSPRGGQHNPPERAVKGSQASNSGRRGGAGPVLEEKRARGGAERAGGADGVERPGTLVPDEQRDEERARDTAGVAARREDPRRESRAHAVHALDRRGAQAAGGEAEADAGQHERGEERRGRRDRERERAGSEDRVAGHGRPAPADAIGVPAPER